MLYKELLIFLLINFYLNLNSKSLAPAHQWIMLQKCLEAT